MGGGGLLAGRCFDVFVSRTYQRGSVVKGDSGCLEATSKSISLLWL